MLGQAQSPLVSGDRGERRDAWSWLVGLALGFLAGSALVVLGIGVAGRLTGVHALPETKRTWLFLAMLLALLVFDVSALRAGTALRLGLSRQTPQRWGRNMRRPAVTAFFWGFDIGTGITTYRMTSAIWLGLVALFLGLIPFHIGWLYGLGFSATVIGSLLWLGERPVSSSLTVLMPVTRWLREGYVVVAVLAWISLLSG